jgi:predicted RND superfamily exporter protein
MKKLSILVFTFLFLTGCYQSMALLGPATGTANGKVIQSSLQTAVSYGIKKQTGKSPFEHVLAYTEQSDLENCGEDNKLTKKCLNLNEKLLSAQSLVEQKDQIITEIKTESKEVIQEKAKSARELAISVQAAIIEKSKIKYLD